MANQQANSGSGGVMVRGFLPGLVLGVVLGAAVAFLSTEILGKSPTFAEGDGTPRVVTGEEREPEGLPQRSREELERMAAEAAAAQSAEEDGSEADGSDTDGDGTEDDG